MKTLVIILAQGQQTRLPDLPVSKTMLPLFVRDSDGLDLYRFAAVAPSDLTPDMLARPRSTRTPHVTIMERTVRQLMRLWADRPVNDYAIRIVASPQTLDLFCVADGQRGRLAPAEGPRHTTMVTRWNLWRPDDILAHGISGMAFASPSNSSLRGIRDTLTALVTDEYLPLDPAERKRLDMQIVVLFGDTIYSWECLQELVLAQEGHWFAITPDLTRSTGEVWGLTWRMSDDQLMMSALTGALRKHPPVDDTYQAGQMRRWLFELATGDLAQLTNHAVSLSHDYTRDIDIPQHLSLLPELARRALADDEENGLRYGSTFD